MASVKFRLRSKANKEVSIKVRLSISRALVLEAKTDFVINPNQWSTTKGKPKPTDVTNKKLAADLSKLDNYLISSYNEDLGTAKVVFDNDWLQNKIKACFNRVVSNDTNLLTNHYQYIIRNSKERGISERRVKNFKGAKKIIEDYQNVIKRKVHFVDLNKRFVEDFKTWLLKSRKYAVSYCNDQIAILKTVAIDAMTLDIQVNSFVTHIKGFSNENKYIITLSFDDLEKIRAVELKREALINARNWLLLGCAIGQRGGDLLRITQDNIRHTKGNLYLDIVQAKTDKAVTIPIADHYIIDIVENNMPYTISDQKLNKYIKEVCEKAELNEVIEGKKWNSEMKRKKIGYYPKYELVTNHSFRRSFATNYYKKVPTPILMGITGHSKESTFLVYINQKEDKDANADLFREFWEKMQENKEPRMKVSKRA